MIPMPLYYDLFLLWCLAVLILRDPLHVPAPVVAERRYPNLNEVMG